MIPLSAARGPHPVGVHTQLLLMLSAHLRVGAPFARSPYRAKSIPLSRVTVLEVGQPFQNATQPQ